MVHSEKILGRMTGVYKNYGSGNLVKLANALGSAADNSSDALSEVKNQHYIPDAEKYGLDMLGADLKTPRFGYDIATQEDTARVSAAHTHVFEIFRAGSSWIKLSDTFDRDHRVDETYVDSLNLVA